MSCKRPEITTPCKANTFLRTWSCLHSTDRAFLAFLAGSLATGGICICDPTLVLAIAAYNAVWGASFGLKRRNALRANFRIVQGTSGACTSCGVPLRWTCPLSWPTQLITVVPTCELQFDYTRCCPLEWVAGEGYAA